MEERRLVVLSISGSLRKESTNSRLLLSMEEMMPTGVDFRQYNKLESLPHFSPDLDADKSEPHKAVVEWRENLRSANAIVICTPEYARGVPGSLKNALDWVVSSGEFMNKPTAVISASPHAEGGASALASLILTLKIMSAAIPEQATLAVPFVIKKLGPDGRVIDVDTLSSLRNLVRALLLPLN
ncbi:NADPH-dependent FMN reductase [Paenibacillus sp. NPDC056579]|uniref:NADPH-dependent FMN reductase n=1 Tax=Paenibacillus sp. NPDC056579 TaxID=3345871 RepID=UPI0036A4A549